MVLRFSLRQGGFARATQVYRAGDRFFARCTVQSRPRNSERYISTKYWTPLFVLPTSSHAGRNDRLVNGGVVIIRETSAKAGPHPRPLPQCWGRGATVARSQPLPSPEVGGGAGG